ncbi:hypothetical protein [Spiroplasma clarkii]|uniref:hypothetical protein n=1 Tax=Spiroplasma clarkii TaxID=2139 RepID=UPI0011BAE113|nr:hypothetical protein [Spiroplasma clarkii]
MENKEEKFSPQRENVEKSESKVKSFFNKQVIPFMGKVGNQTHLSALRDAFGTMVPLLVAGSMGLLLGFIVFGAGGTGKISLLGLLCKAATGWSWDAIDNFGGATTGWAKVSQIGGAMFAVLSDITIGAMSIYFVWLFGYFIAQTRKAPQPIMVGFISLGTFWVVNMGQITWSMGAQGLLSAIILELPVQNYLYF